MTRTKVAITCGGGAGTIAVVEALLKLGYEVSASDATVHSAGLGIASHGYVIPFGVDPSFEGAMREILKRDRPDFVVPTVDEEIPVVEGTPSPIRPAARPMGKGPPPPPAAPKVRRASDEGPPSTMPPPTRRR